MDKTKQVVVLTKQEQKFPRLQRLANRLAVGGVAASTGAVAFANYDITEVTTNIGLAVSAAAAIGVAWLGFTAGIAIWRNLRSAAR